MELYGRIPMGLLRENPQMLTVCGCFSTGIYFESAAGKLYLLHDDKYGLLPFGFGVPDIAAALLLLNASAGTTVHWQQDRLLFFDGKAVLLSPVALPELRRETNRCSREAVRAAAEELRRSGRGAVAELLLCSSLAEAESIFAKTAWPPLKMLSQGICENSPKDIQQALGCIIGLGPGLTPSMDDFLTGALCAFHYGDVCWGYSLQGAGSLARSVLELPPHSTGKYSFTYLRAAAAGERFQLIERVLQDFAPNMVQQLLAVGGHSGADMLTGILWAVSIMNKQCDQI